MRFLGGGRRCCRRPETVCRAAFFLFHLLSAFFLDMAPVSDREISCLSAAHLQGQIRDFKTVEARSISFKERSPLKPQSIPSRITVTYPAKAPWARFTIFINSMAISAWLTAGHGQFRSHNGRTLLLCLSTARRERYGLQLSALRNRIDLCSGFGWVKLNGNNGGVPESVSTFAPSLGHSCWRKHPISNRNWYHRLVAVFPEPFVSASFLRSYLKEQFVLWHCFSAVQLIRTDIFIDINMPESYRSDLLFQTAAAVSLRDLGRTSCLLLGLNLFQNSIMPACEPIFLKIQLYNEFKKSPVAILLKLFQLQNFNFLYCGPRSIAFNSLMGLNPNVMAL